MSRACANFALNEVRAGSPLAMTAILATVLGCASRLRTQGELKAIERRFRGASHLVSVRQSKVKLDALL